MRTIPPFNPKARCPKCCWTEVGTLYKSQGEFQGTPFYDFFLRTCGRCRYEWIEALKESK